MFATAIEHWGYQHIAKPFFFRRDPEAVHDRICAVGKQLGRFAVTRSLVRTFFCYQNPMLVQTIRGIRFPNPIGLTAGFDKNAELTQIMPAVGFGFEEIGSVTGEPCEGNPKPRLWRLPKSKGLVVYYGLKNDGCEAIASRLRGRQFEIPIGTSIARTNNPETVPIEAGVADYVKAFRAFVDIGAYFTLNVSCPNTCGGEPFTMPDRLEQLLAALDPIHTCKPVFLKLPADLAHEELDELMAVAGRHRVHGLIISNLTKRRDRPTIDQTEIQGLDKGGISGRPMFDPSNDLIAHAYRRINRHFILIGSGGVFSAEDAYKKIQCGASFVQLATGMIFEGPQLIGHINRGLVRLLKRDGFSSVSQAVGSAVRS